MQKIKLKDIFSIINDYEIIKIVYNNEIVYYGSSNKRFLNVRNYDILKDKIVESIALENKIVDQDTTIFYKPFMWIYLEK